MRIVNIILAAMAVIIAVEIVSAGSYSIEFNQVQDKLVVRGNVDGVKQEAYVTQEGLEKRSGGYYFLKRIVFNQSYDTAEIRLNLDTGIIVSDSKAYPAGYALETNGQIISLVWKLENAKSGQEFAIFVNLEDTKRTNLLMVWIILGVLVIGSISFFAYKRFGKNKNKIIQKRLKPTSKKEEEKEPGKYEYLLDTEKKVVDELRKADRNELWQKQIQNATGFSKAKVSRLVRNLEARGLVSKIPFGNTNKVRLK